MMPFVAFFIAVMLLLLEGTLLIQIVMRMRWNLFSVTLGYPMGALLNALLFFLMHLMFSLTPLHIGISHGVLLAILVFAHGRRLYEAPVFPLQDQKEATIPLFLSIVAAILLMAVTSAAILHVLTIPNFFWDSFTNWAMRARVSLAAGTFVREGVVQPQYPILLHTLQMLPMVVMGWDDSIANAMTLVLSITGFLSLGCCAFHRWGMRSACVCCAILLSLPLAAVHLEQGYADIHWAMYTILAACTLDIAWRDGQQRWFLLSAFFAAAAAWTKFEGLYFAGIPWSLLVLSQACRRPHRVPCLWSAVWFIVLVIPWPLFVVSHGLLLSPHPLIIQFHPEGVGAVLRSLYIRGTFGIHVWVLTGLLLTLVIDQGRCLMRTLKDQPSLLWGILSVTMVPGIYLVTHDIDGLLQGDNFSRAMMGPILLLTFALWSFWCEKVHAAL